MSFTAESSSSTNAPASAELSGLNPAKGFCLWLTMDMMSCDTSMSSCSRDGGVEACFKVAIVSWDNSIGPPGSASEIAIPATNGARRRRFHSSSV